MGRANSALKVPPSFEEDNSSATNCNADKVRISYLKETLNKILRDPKMAKKAAHIIEEMLQSSPQMPNK